MQELAFENAMAGIFLIEKFVGVRKAYPFLGANILEIVHRYPSSSVIGLTFSHDVRSSMLSCADCKSKDRENDAGGTNCSGTSDPDIVDT